MSAIDAAMAYFNAWNERDAGAVLASMSEGGTYSDPLTGGPICGKALRGYCEGLWDAFPDLRFEITSAAETGDGRVAAEWIMRGTNRGSFRGLPPTGNEIESHGSDFIQTVDGKVTSVIGYFDGGAVPRQLGLQVVVQPQAIGPFAFGTSVSFATGRQDKPGAFSVTQLTARDEAAAEKIRDYSRQILAEMAELPGFIGAVTARIGLRQMTLTAWTDADAPAKFMRKGIHGEAMKPFYDGSLSESGYTSVWLPERINPYWVRCQACGKMADSEAAAGTCRCGAEIPDHPPYW